MVEQNSPETITEVEAPGSAPVTEEPVATAPVKDNTDAALTANMSMDQLSYICEYCGKVNPIAAPKCTRCGKRRPRSEYLNAMARLKNVETVKQTYVAEEARLEADRRETMEQQITRLVEARVAEEKARLEAQHALQIEQDRDEIKKYTARDAVQRILAAEKAADERIADANYRADEALRGASRGIDERIAEEREKIIYEAAKKLVQERAGIEQAAEDRIQAEKKDIQLKSAETIATMVDDAERDAARKAVLKVLAAEQASDDKTRLSREAIQRAAIDRIAEERAIADVKASAKYNVQKEGIEKAIDDRIMAERARLQGLGYVAPSPVEPQQGGASQYVQPLTIVPYVNTQQPLYQYNPNGQRMVFKFIPDEPAYDSVEEGFSVEEPVVVPRQGSAVPAPMKEPKAKPYKDKKVHKVRSKKRYYKKSPAAYIFGLIFALLIVAVAVIGYFNIDSIAGYINVFGTKDGGNIDMVSSFLALCGVTGENAVVNTEIVIDGGMSWAAYGMIIAPVVEALFALIIVICCIFAIARRREADGYYSKIKFGWMAIVMLVAALATIVFGYLYQYTTFDNIGAYFIDGFGSDPSELAYYLGYGAYGLVLLPILVLICVGCSHKKVK